MREIDNMIGQMSIFEYAEYKQMTQCERIIHYIKKHGSISTIEAFSELGITRLASRIHDLSEDGYSINRETVSARNRYGEPIHYTRYSLGELRDG